MNDQTIKRSNDPATSLMHVKLTHLTMMGATGTIAERIALRHYNQPLTVFTPNTEQLMQARDNQTFLKALNTADVTIPDSVGLMTADWWRAAVTGTPWIVRERVAGVELAENLLFTAAKQGWKVVLLGGMDNSAAEAVDNLKKRFDSLQIWSAPVGEIDSQGGGESGSQAVGKINGFKPDLVLVGLGAPKQEAWVLRHREELATQVVMVVGGAIDMWAGRVARAPQWCRKIGCEWLWRLMKEPARWRRQLRLLQFAGVVVRGK